MSLTSLASSFADAYVNAPEERRLGRAAPPIHRRLGAAAAAAAVAAGPAAAAGGAGLPPGPAGAAPPPPGGGAGGGGGGGSGSPLSDNLKSLTDYIPSEVLTLYIAALAAIAKWPFTDPKTGKALTEPSLTQVQTEWSSWVFTFCMVAAPIWIVLGVFLASKSTPKLTAFVWPTIAAAIAFFVYALAIPNSWLATFMPNGGLLGTIGLLVITPVLHAGTMVYTKLFPPS